MTQQQPTDRAGQGGTAYAAAVAGFSPRGLGRRCGMDRDEEFVSRHIRQTGYRVASADFSINELWPARLTNIIESHASQICTTISGKITYRNKNH